LALIAERTELAAAEARGEARGEAKGWGNAMQAALDRLMQNGMPEAQARAMLGM
jgi:hypothetical protein